ncbi:MAG: DUF6049 family protein [Propionibacteriaceae bacterium]|nr:DUF6049 family protein [Propionibacteriaceae bacterium]
MSPTLGRHPHPRRPSVAPSHQLRRPRNIHPRLIHSHHRHQPFIGRTALAPTIHHGLARRLLASLIGGLTVLAYLISPAPIAQADTVDSRIALTNLTSTTTGLELSLTVTNTGDTPLYSAEVMLWRDTNRVDDQATMNDLMAADPTANSGGRLGWPNVEAYHVLSDADVAFPPGQTTAIQLRASWPELGLTQPGVYLVGAQLHASTTPDGEGSVIARARTWVVRPGGTTVERGYLIALTSTPSLLGSNRFSDDHLASEMAPRTGNQTGGRLTELVLAAGQSGQSARGWLIDPALYQAAQIMAGGYQFYRDGEWVTGTGQTVAQQWLARVDALPRAHGYRTLWNNPDLALAAQLSATSIIDRAVQAWNTAVQPTDGKPSRVATLGDLPLVIAPADGIINHSLWQLVADQNPQLGLGQTDLTTADLTTDVSILPVVTPAFADGPGPDDATTDLQRRQRALAEDYLNGLADQTSLRILTTTDDLALADNALPAWVTNQPFDPTAEANSADSPDQLDPPQPRLTAAQAETADQLATGWQALAELTGQSATAAQSPTAAVSQSWPDPTAAAPYLELAQSELAGQLAKVHVTLYNNIVLTSRNTTFPVTVVNELSQPVDVHLTFTSSSPIRLTVEYPTLIHVAAGDHVTVAIQPLIRANGTVELSANLTTSSGQAFSSPASSQVRINQTGRLAWAIVAVSGLVLTIGTVLRVKTVQRSRRLANPTDDTTQPGGHQ